MQRCIISLSQCKEFIKVWSIAAGKKEAIRIRLCNTDRIRLCSTEDEMLNGGLRAEVRLLLLLLVFQSLSSGHYPSSRAGQRTQGDGRSHMWDPGST